MFKRALSAGGIVAFAWMLIACETDPSRAGAAGPSEVTVTVTTPAQEPIDEDAPGDYEYPAEPVPETTSSGGGSSAAAPQPLVAPPSPVPTSTAPPEPTKLAPYADPMQILRVLQMAGINKASHALNPDDYSYLSPQHKYVIVTAGTGQTDSVSIATFDTVKAQRSWQDVSSNAWVVDGDRWMIDGSDPRVMKEIARAMRTTAHYVE